MQSSINNLKAMKVNFRNRKLHLNFPKDQVLKSSEIKETINHDHHQKPPSVGNNVQKVPSGYLHERIEMDRSKDSYIDSIADTIHLIGQEYVTYLNEGKEERFKAAILSTLTNLEARDRKIVIEYGYEYNSQGQVEFDFDKQQQKFKQWLGEVHFRIVSTSFDFQLNKLLAFQQVKVYCSQNLLLNIILFIQKVQNRIKGISLTDFMLFIDNTLNQNLQYLMVKYPQAKQMKPNKRLREQVQPINNMENDINDILQYCGVDFEFHQTQNYNSQIMRVINYLIEVMAEEVVIQDEKHSFSNGFFEIMENIFMSTYLPEAQDKQLKEKTKTLSEYKKEAALLFEDNNNKQVKEYKQKVAKYSSYKLGTKLNPNTQLFTESQIKAGFFDVKSTGILRILTKWIEELQKKIFQAKQYIQKRSFRFKNSKKSFSKLNASQKNDLYLEATKQIQKLKECIKEIRTNAFSIQGQLAMTMKRNKDKINIPKHEYMVGEFSSKLQDAASSSLLSYLNQIIHILLLIPKNIRSKYSHDDELLKEMQINLITFKTSDLLRCKFSSHQNQILRAYRELKRLSDEKDYLKIVRIKDRLQMGTRDILININYMDKMLCEIQLAVTDQIDTKQQAFDAFNHYLYELKRSNLGAIMQSACIWAHFDQRSSIYKRIKERYIEDYYLGGSVKRVKHDCKQPLVDNDLPFVCSVCEKFYYSQHGIIRHKKCKQCMKFYHCALCLENKMSQEELKSFLGLDKSLDVFIDQFEQWTDDGYPKHGIIIPKRNKTVQIYFFVTILWKQHAYIVRTVETENSEQEIVQVIKIVKNNELKEWKKLKESYIIYEWLQTRNANKTIKPTSIRNAQFEEQQKRKREEELKKEKKLKQIQQVKAKWRKKVKGFQKDEQNQQGSRPGSSESNISRKSGNRAKQKQKQTMLQHMLPPIQQQKTPYIESIAKVSTKQQFRVAVKTGTEEGQKQIKEVSYLVLGPYYKEREIRAELKKINNRNIIRELLQRKMEVLFLEDMLIESELELQQKDYDKYSNSLSKITEIYLDSNLISSIGFLQKMPKLNVVHLNYNSIDDMRSLSKLDDLTELMLQYNKLTQISGMNGKKKLTQINLNQNTIAKIQGLQEVPKLQVLTLADNQIQQIEGLSMLINLKKLDLSYNGISAIKGLQNLVNLEELDLSDNHLTKIESLTNLKKLRKLNFYRNFISKIQGLQNLTQLKYLDLHRNSLTKIENLDQLKKLLYLNLSSNRIRVIEGLKETQSLTELNLCLNEILSLKPVIQNSLGNVRILDLSYNGIRKLIIEIISFLPKLQKFFINENPIKPTKAQKDVHKKLSSEFMKRSKFQLCSIPDDDDGNNSDSDYEAKQQEKLKRINQKRSLPDQ